MSEELKQIEREFEADAVRINAGRKPKFGDLMRNPWASEENPRRDAYFVRKCGQNYEFTDKKGNFWETRAKFAFFVEPSTSPASDAELRGAAELVMNRYDELRKGREPAAEFEILRAAIASTRTASDTPEVLGLDSLAWALVAPNGNIRLWSRNRAAVERMHASAPECTFAPIIGVAASDTRTAAGEAECDAALGQ